MSTLEFSLTLDFCSYLCNCKRGKHQTRCWLFHKYGLFIDLQGRCVVDSENHIRLQSVISYTVPLCHTQSNAEYNLGFCKLLDKFSSITKLFFHKETLPCSITYQINTSGHPIYKCPWRLALDKLWVAKLNLTKWWSLASYDFQTASKLFRCIYFLKAAALGGFYGEYIIHNFVTKSDMFPFGCYVTWRGHSKYCSCRVMLNVPKQTVTWSGHHVGRSRWLLR